MKLTEIKPGEGLRHRLKDGTVTRTFRLGFVPINRMGWAKALEYVAGQHWQYMDFAWIPNKNGKGGTYLPIRGGMRDVHDLGTGKITKGVERLFAKPVLNKADWTFKTRRPETKPRKEYVMSPKKSRIMQAASAPARIYGPEPASPKLTDIRKDKLGRLAQIAAKAMSLRKNPSLLFKGLMK